MDDNSVLMEDSNMEDTLTNPPRRSLSQPTLDAKTTQAPKPSSANNPKQIPILATWHENEELKGRMYTMRVEVQMHKRNYLEAKEACHKSVQEVLDEYVELKLAQEDAQEKAHEFVAMQNELEAMREKAERQDELHELQKQQWEQRIRELEQAQLQTAFEPNNTTMGSLHGNLDDILKKSDPNFTISSYEERKISELENKLYNEREKVTALEEHVRVLLQEIQDQSARLADAENQRAQLEAFGNKEHDDGATFVLGNVRESATTDQLQYIDELETKLKAASSESEKARLALVEYMNRCSRLENDVLQMKKNATFDTSSMLFGKSSEELKAQIEKVNVELNTLRTENRELRMRCDQLNGGDGNVSESLAESRLMAGISPSDEATKKGAAAATANESQLLDMSRISLMDSSSTARNNEVFDSEWEKFQTDQRHYVQQQQQQQNNTMESSFNASMPPPGADATQSFLSQKGQKNVGDNSFSTKSTLPVTNAANANSNTPLLQDVQQLLESSQLFMEQHDVAGSVEKMQDKMRQIRDALSRLFERLKSSAALFEEILEKMGASSPLADRIQQMKLAFETSLCDHDEVSQFLEAAEMDLTNLSLNFSVLEKSMAASFDVSRRGVHDESLTKAPYSPVFKLPSLSRAEEIQRLQKEVTELKNELHLAHARELKSPLHDAPGRLSDVQIMAAQNFEELEVCQATLKKVETEKASLQKELDELTVTHRNTLTEIGDARARLEELVEQHAKEKAAREAGEQALAALQNDVEQKSQETREQHQAQVKHLEQELKNSLLEENGLRDLVDQMKVEAGRLELRIHEAESLAHRQDAERANLVQQMYALENEMTVLRKFEKEATDYSKKLAERKDEMVHHRQQEESAREAIAGLERIQRELAELTKKALKRQPVVGDASSVRTVCDEICRRLSQERHRQHDDAEELRVVNDQIERLQIDKENALGSGAAAPAPSTSDHQKAKYQCPTRQLLREATIAVDSMVQRVKKACATPAMPAELKNSLVELLVDARSLREFLHQKLTLFKGIDVANWKKETVEQLLERLEQCYQSNLMLEDDNRKLKRDLKKVKMDIAGLGNDVQERIKREIGGIAKDMGAVKALQKKK